MMSPSGEALKLSILCMRTGFTQARQRPQRESVSELWNCQYLDKDELLKLAGSVTPIVPTVVPSH